MRNDKSVCKEYVCWAYCNMTLYYTSKGLCDNADRTILDGIDYFQNANINEYKSVLYIDMQEMVRSINVTILMQLNISNYTFQILIQEMDVMIMQLLPIH